mmetsp:Transcript_70261/g.189967  ORF Transcript_70261/g.189967 Transcript_70261/m.189967 type:complete len:471 (-) Transcript_70261:7-1419(-)
MLRVPDHAALLLHHALERVLLVRALPCVVVAVPALLPRAPPLRGRQQLRNNVHLGPRLADGLPVQHCGDVDCGRGAPLGRRSAVLQVLDRDLPDDRPVPTLLLASSRRRRRRGSGSTEAPALLLGAEVVPRLVRQVADGTGEVEVPVDAVDHPPLVALPGVDLLDVPAGVDDALALGLVGRLVVEREWHCLGLLAQHGPGVARIRADDVAARHHDANRGAADREGGRRGVLRVRFARVRRAHVLQPPQHGHLHHHALRLVRADPAARLARLVHAAGHRGLQPRLRETGGAGHRAVVLGTVAALAGPLLELQESGPVLWLSQHVVQRVVGAGQGPAPELRVVHELGRWAGRRRGAACRPLRQGGGHVPLEELGHLLLAEVGDLPAAVPVEHGEEGQPRALAAEVCHREVGVLLRPAPALHAGVPEVEAIAAPAAALLLGDRLGQVRPHAACAQQLCPRRRAQRRHRGHRGS